MRRWSVQTLKPHLFADPNLGNLAPAQQVKYHQSKQHIMKLIGARHLDDNHKNLEEVKQDEVKDWFKTQMVKAKKFQPLAVLNQKFKGLDVFESNESPRSSTPVPNAPVQERAASDPDEVITRAHWQRQGPNDLCSEPVCGQRLGTANGKVNCRKCGRLFCDEHTMYQMKLSRSAQHEPVRGLWCRVCETCYKSRDGYNDRHGILDDHWKGQLPSTERLIFCRP